MRRARVQRLPKNSLLQLILAQRFTAAISDTLKGGFSR